MEGDDASHSRNRGGGPAPEKADFWDSFGAAPQGPSKDKKDFWDEFAAAGESVQTAKTQPKPSSIGTAAMKKPGGGAGAPKKENEEWSEW